MTEKTSCGINQADELQNRINQALKALNEIRNTRQSITDPDGLERVERAILKATDNIAVLMTALKIQQAVDSDELREKASELVQAMPEKLKNQGRRPVSVKTSRGAAVTVSAKYFSRKKKTEGGYGLIPHIIHIANMADKDQPELAQITI